MQTVSFGDTLHRMPKPIFWEKEIYHHFVICLISPEKGKGQPCHAKEVLSN